MSDILIHEVGPRDGLQIEKSVVPTDTKIAWIERLMASRVDVIQLGSFVSSERMPQMADTERLFMHFNARSRKPGQTELSALVLNEKGLDRGFASGVDYFCMGVSASDTHSRKNTGMTTEEALKRIVAMADRALAAGAKVQVSVQSAFGCGYEGVIPQERVLHIIKRYLEAGLTTISLADTAGHAQPSHVEDLFGTIRDLAPYVICACHFHDTYGMAMANCYAAYRSGVQSFESASAGLGGCPFTAVTGGNVATEDLVHMFQQMGLRTDINLDALIGAAKDAEQFLGRALPGRILATGPVPDAALSGKTVPAMAAMVSS
ncbi:MAG TPA: hydroxymethylglutaryl-CoA lyase [Thermoanaerobaculia bacterium]|nr:hydroxymethylglutaryl-CoA lyase [Thermoanaerobaculia bacterium]